MLRGIKATQFLDWMAYDQLEPIGARRSDWQAASICAMMMNVALMQAGSPKRFSASDFILEFGEAKPATKPAEQPRQSWQEQKMIARMFFAASKADEAKKKKWADTPKVPRKRKRNG